jgi:hypothetical protein
MKQLDSPNIHEAVSNKTFFNLDIVKQIAFQLSYDWKIYFNNNEPSKSSLKDKIISKKNAITYATMRVIEWILYSNYFNYYYIINRNYFNFSFNKHRTKKTISPKKMKIYVSFIMGRKVNRKRSIIMCIFWFIIWLVYAIKCVTNKDIRQKMKNNNIADLNSFIVFDDALSYLRIPSKNHKEYSELVLLSTSDIERKKGFASNLLDIFEYDLAVETELQKKLNQKVVSIPLVLFTTSYCNHEIYEKRGYVNLIEYDVGDKYTKKQYVYFLEPCIDKRFEKNNYKFKNEDPIDANLAEYMAKQRKRQEEINKLPKFMDVKKKANAVKEIDSRLNF